MLMSPQTRRGRIRPGKAAGAVTLLTVVAMLSVLLATASAMASLMIVAHHTVYWRLEREIAFRGAEVALADAEADLNAAFEDPRHRRLSPLPVPGMCGTGMQQGLCMASARAAPPWQNWLAPDTPGSENIGVAVGRFTGAQVPPIAGDAGGGARSPRYLVEVLGRTAHAPLAPASLPDPAAARGSQREPDRAPKWATFAFRITAIGYGRDPAVRAVLQAEWLGALKPTSPHGSRHAGRISWRELVPM
ncbi:Tfp pilus assembly protein PilX [Cupriavidus gilardii J11]|uniref:Tfp pilus assembly protein PilX n=1 Tax=Cupriavidus gilardii J11 TaxID=936133 RepID=A0A562BMT0_9BURK|nr:pilus assembly protein [Cupriavidus gilardii]TWG86249.1 Tfp pilus assembly protein PilX [Cupriavidus gilardii J11]